MQDETEPTVAELEEMLKHRAINNEGLIYNEGCSL